MITGTKNVRVSGFKKTFNLHISTSKHFLKNKFAMADPVSLSEPEPEIVLEPVHNVPEQLQETTKHQTTVVNFTGP